MDLLILGGSRFLGLHLTRAALERGHRVTLFNRGKSNPGPFPDVEELRGERAGDLSALRGRSWSAAIDTSGYLSRDVRASAGLLAESVEHYTFVSSISVYGDFGRVGMDEGAPVLAPPDPEPEESSIELYGELKIGCERAAEAAMPGRTLVVRPGMIVGPNDRTNRFSYWCRRVAEGGEILAPGDPDRPVQLIDVRDLAGWMLRMAEGRSTGVYNATGPEYELTMRGMLEGIREATGSDAGFVWTPEEFLLDAGVRTWEELPFWVPEEMAGILSVSVDEALRAGLAFRPLTETVRGALEGDGHEAGIEAGMARDRERELLRAWRGSNL
ncbi:NAD-dependent epimerase/dehydratase family protein [Rubrobacter tropicus]|uniref:NAD-dependent epimerase/dehydratase family protein n=1 Tax=Rubrobacter tropicus TaxID=2653851 RepID=A0A6G8QEA2_9ACTN|nr:NAD-dependent epimerase/dehydratase family protein [Rubrobacter tropicus]QIN84768.1 NAD-dependent epimerase/dehydratase family protein [Rubrobacter tropicus]